MTTERRDTRSGRGLRRRPAARPGAGWWLIARDGAGRIEPLTVGGNPTPGGEEALAVFGFEEEAEIFLRFGNLDGGGWRTMETRVGELASVLLDPCRRAGRVALDPLPGTAAGPVNALASVGCRPFLDFLLRNRGARRRERKRASV